VCRVNDTVSHLLDSVDCGLDVIARGPSESFVVHLGIVIT